jgi:transcriptional regulator with XRE-family HTH domain
MTINPSEQCLEPDIHHDVMALRLGEKIRQLRHRRNLTLQGVADLSGLSKSLLSQIENEATIPPIATLARIARALRVGVGHFFKETRTRRRISFVPASQRCQVVGTPHNRPDHVGYSYQALSHPLANQHMEPFWVELLPRPESELIFFQHPGEEFIFVQQGRLEFHSRDETFILDSGDCLYFDANIPHAARNPGTQKAQALVVLFAED